MKESKLANLVRLGSASITVVTLPIIGVALVMVMVIVASVAIETVGAVVWMHIAWTSYGVVLGPARFGFFNLLDFVLELAGFLFWKRTKKMPCTFR